MPRLVPKALDAHTRDHSLLRRVKRPTQAATTCPGVMSSAALTFKKLRRCRMRPSSSHALVCDTLTSLASFTIWSIAARVQSISKITESPLDARRAEGLACSFSRKQEQAQAANARPGGTGREQ